MKATPREYDILESLLETTGGDFDIEIAKAKMDGKESMLIIIQNVGQPKLIISIDREESKEEKKDPNIQLCDGKEKEEATNETKDIPKSSEDKQDTKSVS